MFLVPELLFDAEPVLLEDFDAEPLLLDAEALLFDAEPLLLEADALLFDAEPLPAVRPALARFDP